MASSLTGQTHEYELFLIWSIPDGGGLPHWILMAVPRLTDNHRLGYNRIGINETRYHSTGRPTEGITYRIAVQASTNFRGEKNFKHWQFLCTLSAQNYARLPEPVNEMPAYQSQKFVVYILALMQEGD